MNATVAPSPPPPSGLPPLEIWGWEGWLTLLFLVAMIAALLKDFPTDGAMLLTLAMLMATQVVSSAEGLEGFASPAVLAVAALYVVAHGISSTGALDYLANKALGAPQTLSVSQFRLMVPVAFISAFLNNTPVVAVGVPILQMWARKVSVPVSQLFIPLSYASILGGTVTLIGTSTNLVVAGKAAEAPTYIVIGLFDIAIVGVPVLCTGLAYIFLFSRYLLPDAAELVRRARAQGLSVSKSPTGDASDSFALNCVVSTNSTDVIGKSVTEAKLRGLPEIFLTGVTRAGVHHSAIGPSFVVEAGDVLSFTGTPTGFHSLCVEKKFDIVTIDEDGGTSEKRVNNVSVSTVLSAARRHEPTGRLFREASDPDKSPVLMSSLSLAEDDESSTEFVHAAVVRDNSDLIGKTPKEVDFRNKYQAAILSVHREGESLEKSKLGRLRLKVGDVLLLLSSEGFSWSAASHDLKPQFRKDQLHTRSRATDEDEFSGSREFLMGMRVAKESKLIGTRTLGGRTVTQAGLRGLPGVFLVAIEREDGTLLRAVGPHEVIENGDTLYFVGERDALNTLRRIPGLEDPNSDQVDKIKSSKIRRRLVEAVISLNSELLHKTVRESKFRTKFNAAIVGVHRHGTRILGKVGDIVLEPGDVLVLDTGPNFLKNHRDDRNFALISEIENSSPPQFDKFYASLACVLAMMISYVFASDKVSLVTLAILAAAVMLFVGCMTIEAAREAVNWEVIVTIACAFGISNAMESSGVASTFGNALVRAADGSGTGEIGLLVAVYAATFLLSTVVANNAAALLMFPIAIQASELTGYDSTRMLYCLMLAASSSFMSPFGYQTNLMIFHPGNYVVWDFVKFGGPMQIWQMVFSIIFLINYKLWYATWPIALAFVSVSFAVAYRMDKQQVVVEAGEEADVIEDVPDAIEDAPAHLSPV